MAKIHRNSLLRARKNLQVKGVATYTGLFSRNFEGSLPAGEILMLEYEPSESVNVIWVVPQKYTELEKSLVPREVRAERGYSGYVVGCRLDQLAENYEVVCPSN